ncbi:hypothetical protein ElyMa_005558200 [Elysia marginata]|uniref:Uncharacterized protein n=1 Tax=Elysia marginata TaxID=1093978 RepID=A0AAV4F1X5_9GAST|nr:hypothetical protein ElyMa_005558200 [Elysia marginata]
MSVSDFYKRKIRNLWFVQHLTIDGAGAGPRQYSIQVLAIVTLTQSDGGGRGSGGDGRCGLCHSGIYYAPNDPETFSVHVHLQVNDL